MEMKKETINLIIFWICSYIILVLVGSHVYKQVDWPWLVFYAIPSTGATILYVAFREAFKEKEMEVK